MKKAVRTVRFSDGGTFQTTAQSAGEYLLAPVFLRFYLVCIVLYAATSHRGITFEVDPLASVLFWASILMTSFIFLLGSIWLNMFLVDRGIVKNIHTYVALLPVVFFNTMMVDYMIRQFGSSYEEQFGSLLFLTFRNVVIVCCYDILHGRFVAPQHPTYVANGSLPKDDIVSSSNALRPDIRSQSVFEPATMNEVPQLVSDPIAQGPVTETGIEIGNKSYKPCEIMWIRSEDHYLKVNRVDASEMVRGKLSDVAAKIDANLGLQVNRSVWVAFAAINTAEKVAGNYASVCLFDDTIHKIANSRKLVFKHNYDRFLEQT